MSDWADHYIRRLGEGETFTFTAPNGNSMRPKINPRDLVTIGPPSREPQKGDIVLCRVKGRQYLHLVSAVETKGEDRRYQISNNSGHVNGWIGAGAVYGIVEKVG